MDSTDNTKSNKKDFKSVVLLIDDQAMVAEGIRRMLADQDDIVFHYCQNPADAIKTATEIGATIILQDLVMPDVDGMTLVRFYRNNPTTKDTPVIVLSTKEDPKIKSEAFETGASDYLVKLPDKIELIARIRAHSKSYIAQKERDEAFKQLREMQKDIERANAQLEVSNAALHRLSTIDALTNIANRRHFDNSLELEWKRAIRDASKTSIILIDIDSFKLYNDHYGHLGGDDCLQKVAKAIASSVKRPADLVARYGGEEFVIILGDTDNEGAAMVAERMRANVEGLKLKHELSQASDYVTISLGVATTIPTENLKAADLVLKADEQLYKSKENGRNQLTTIEI